MIFDVDVDGLSCTLVGAVLVLDAMTGIEVSSMSDSGRWVDVIQALIHVCHMYMILGVTRYSAVRRFNLE